MDDHDAAKPSEEGPFRRAYAWPILLGPWACAVVGLVILGFGLLVNSPSQVRITELVLGAAMVFAGTLMPRMTGPLELGAAGFKGQVDSIPMALALAHRAAENAIPEDEPDRDERAKEAAERAVLDLAFWDELGRIPLADWDYVMFDLWKRERRRRPEPPDEPPLAAKPS
jgi:hypothetical protein